MSLDVHVLPIVASVALGLGSLVAWYLLYRWSERGTEAGLPVSPISTFAHQALMTAYFVSVIVNGFLGDSDGLPLTIIRSVVSLTVVASLVAWAVAERRRRSTTAIGEQGRDPVAFPDEDRSD